MNLRRLTQPPIHDSGITLSDDLAHDALSNCCTATWTPRPGLKGRSSNSVQPPVRCTTDSCRGCCGPEDARLVPGHEIAAAIAAARKSGLGQRWEQKIVA